MRWLFVLAIFFPLLLQGQVATFRELRAPCTKFNDDDTAISIIYPIVVLPNTNIAARINKALKATLLDEDIDDSTLSTEASLKQYAHERLVEMSYTVLFNKNGLLSMETVLNVSGIYDYEFKRHFTFNLTTGKLLTLADIIEPTKYEGFKKAMLQRKIIELQKYEQEKKRNWLKGDISKDLYEMCIGKVKDGGCMEKISLKEFTIKPGYIEVYDVCFFPHTMMSEKPFYRLIYFLGKGQGILQPAIVKQLFDR